MDACIRHRVNYFAINVQIMNENNKLTIRTLVEQDSHALHTGNFIKCLAEEVLKELSISKLHLSAVVTDNAANMTHSVEKLNTEPDVSEDECIAPGLSISNDSEQEECSLMQ